MGEYTKVLASGIAKVQNGNGITGMNKTAATLDQTSRPVMLARDQIYDQVVQLVLDTLPELLAVGARLSRPTEIFKTM